MMRWGKCQGKCVVAGGVTYADHDGGMGWGTRHPVARVPSRKNYTMFGVPVAGGTLITKHNEKLSD